MADLIDRQAAIDAVRSYYDEFDEREESIEERIEQLPSADAVEVVRCKDCRWYKTNYMWNSTEIKICAKEAYEPRRNADDFCSHGERK